MNIIICFLVGWLCGTALQKKGDTAYWLPAAATVAALLPQVELFYYFLGEGFRLQYFYGFSWSILLAPFAALAVALAFGAVSGRGLVAVFPAAMLGVAVSIFMGALTSNGAQIFAPVLSWRLALNIIDVFDLFIFAFTLLGVIFGVILPAWRNRIARFALVLVAIYIIIVATFAWKAHQFAQQYVDGFNLQVEKIHTLPQPISPFNWRIIIETTSGRLHDTRVNLFRTEPLKIDETAKRSWRIYAQYKPLDQAIWRIYPRYGRLKSGRAMKFIKSTWASLHDSTFGWRTRFAVFKQFVSFSNTQCVQYQDLIKAGANRSYAGQYLVCLAPKGYTLYKADSETSYKRLAVLPKAE